MSSSPGSMSGSTQDSDLPSSATIPSTSPSLSSIPSSSEVSLSSSVPIQPETCWLLSRVDQCAVRINELVWRIRSEYQALRESSVQVDSSRIQFIVDSVAEMQELLHECNRVSSDCIGRVQDLATKYSTDRIRREIRAARASEKARTLSIQEPSNKFSRLGSGSRPFSIDNRIPDGQYVAARFSGRDEDLLFILAVVNSYLGPQRKKYGVFDVEDQVHKIHLVPEEYVLPLPYDPDENADAPTSNVDPQMSFLPPDTRVLAIYPGTTAFYPAVVVAPPKRKSRNLCYTLEFDDDDAAEEGNVVRHEVSFRHVVEMPPHIQKDFEDSRKRMLAEAAAYEEETQVKEEEPAPVTPPPSSHRSSSSKSRSKLTKSR